MMRRVKMVLRLCSMALAIMLIVTSAGPAAAAAQVADAPTAQNPVVAACTTVAANLTLRQGPGTAFPAAGSLLQGTKVRGIAFVRVGVPRGSWIEVELAAGISSGFLPADAQSVQCQPAVTALPAAQAPPAPVQSRQRISRVAVDGGDVANPVLRGPDNLKNGQYVIVPGFDPAQVRAVLNANGGRVRFGDAVGFGVEVFDRRVGRANGNGIARVKFEIVDQNQGETVYYTEEENAPYCLFSDENNQCNIFRFSKMGYKWPDTRFAKGLPRSPGETSYGVTITIVAKNGDEVQWVWSFDQNAIAVELP